MGVLTLHNTNWFTTAHQSDSTKAFNSMTRNEQTIKKIKNKNKNRNNRISVT